MRESTKALETQAYESCREIQLPPVEVWNSWVMVWKDKAERQSQAERKMWVLGLDGSSHQYDRRCEYPMGLRLEFGILRACW